MLETNAGAVQRPGNSGSSVGHTAKAAVAEARANGIDLPRNAQGMAAAAIAKGAEPGSVFAALAVPDITQTDGASAATLEAPPDQRVTDPAGYGYTTATTATSSELDATRAMFNSTGRS